ncbi:MAG TPA: glycosyltransferase [Bacteroidia bacterium]|nr:glycosyltransferase [Bacteroidia bacterium]
MLFSIIIPTYNRASFIATTIQSVLNQTHPHFEIIVVDDGSTDNTEEVVKKIKDKRINYYQKKNEERAAARNYGISKAKGDYITFLDSDDILLPNHLDEAKKIFEKETNVEWLHLGYKMVTIENKLLYKIKKFKGNINSNLFQGNFISCNGIFIRKDIAIENLFNKIRALSASEDHELWLRLASQYQLKFSNNITSVIINHEYRSVLNINKDVLIERQKVFLDLILSNHSLKKFITGYEYKLKSNSYSYIALHLALTGKYKKTSLVYLLKAIQTNYLIIFNKRFFAIIKHILLTH